MRRIRFVVVLCGLILANAGCTRTVHGQLRIVTYNVAKLNSENAANPNCVPGSLGAVFASLNDDDRYSPAVAPHVYVFQEVPAVDLLPLEALLNDAAPSGVTYLPGTYTNNGDQGGAQAMFYRPDTLDEIACDHLDIPTGGGRETDRWRLQVVDNPSPGAGFYIYSSHLKASPGGPNEDERLVGVMAIRANADSLPEGTQIIFAGDMNFHDNGETGYLEFLSPGAGQAFDPLETGPWDCIADPTTAIKNTQSPRALQSCGLIGGAMDDRFDFQLVTAELLDGVGISLVPGSYRALGNDGLHCDIAINAGDNMYFPADLARSNALADALHDASDHLPVVGDYSLPGPCAEVPDLLMLLAAWGTVTCGPPDLNGDGNVGVPDLLTLLAARGACK
ncbi:MAG: hypothetical protein V3T48_09340 [Vicinamibacterales bacterium]